MAVSHSWLLLTAVVCLMLMGCGDSRSGKIPTEPASPADASKAKDMGFGGTKK